MSEDDLEFIPTVTRGDVLRIVERDFGAANVDVVMKRLDTYGEESYERERDRVQAAILRLSAGDMKKLEQQLRVAKTDYRDVVTAAESPWFFKEGVNSLEMSREELKRRYGEDRRSYESWFHRK